MSQLGYPREFSRVSWVWRVTLLIRLPPTHLCNGVRDQVTLHWNSMQRARQRKLGLECNTGDRRGKRRERRRDDPLRFQILTTSNILMYFPRFCWLSFSFIVFLVLILVLLAFALAPRWCYYFETMFVRRWKPNIFYAKACSAGFCRFAF